MVFLGKVRFYRVHVTWFFLEPNLLIYNQKTAVESRKLLNSYENVETLKRSQSVVWRSHTLSKTREGLVCVPS